MQQAEAAREGSGERKRCEERFPRSDVTRAAHAVGCNHGISGASRRRHHWPDNRAQAQQLGRIKASARHLLSLIDEILTFTRLDAGRETVLVEKMDLE